MRVARISLAATGEPLLPRPMAIDTGAPMAQLTSSGVAIAQHTVFVEATGSGNEGYLIAYGAGSG